MIPTICSTSTRTYLQHLDRILRIMRKAHFQNNNGMSLDVDGLCYGSTATGKRRPRPVRFDPCVDASPTNVDQRTKVTVCSFEPTKASILACDDWQARHVPIIVSAIPQLCKSFAHDCGVESHSPGERLIVEVVIRVMKRRGISITYESEASGYVLEEAGEVF